MRYVLAIAFLFYLFTGCKKIKQNVQEEAVVDFIASGQWKVTRLEKGDSSFTADFIPYRFQFRDNLTVDAQKNGTTELSGIWTGNPIDKTITANFNTTQRPLVLLNGTWQINRSSSTFVEASQARNDFTFHIRLEKL